MSEFDFESRIIDIPDYPEPGVVFKDITPLFDDAEALRAVIDDIADHFADRGITKVVGAEARGFMVGVPIAYRARLRLCPGAQARQAPARGLLPELLARVRHRRAPDPPRRARAGGPRAHR